MVTGGTVTPGDLSLIGDLAEDAFSSLRFDTLSWAWPEWTPKWVVPSSAPTSPRKKGRPRHSEAVHRRRRQLKAGRGDIRPNLPLDSVNVVVTDDRARPNRWLPWSRLMFKLSWRMTRDRRRSIHGS